MQLMTIAIDARAYGWAGVGRYTRNLLHQLALAPQEQKYIVLLRRQDRASFENQILPLAPERFDIREVTPSYYSWREQTIFLKQLYGAKADLYHFTHFNAPLLFNRPYVVTVHDTARFIFPGQRRQSLLYQLAYEQVFRHAVERARGVICVSEAARHDLQKLPLKLPGLVRTIPEGVSQDFAALAGPRQRQRLRLRLGTSDPYVLYVGVWMNHKNLPRLLEALAAVARHLPDIKLVLTGKPRPGYVDMPREASRLGLEADKIICAGFVPQPLLPALYAEAACLVLPSLYEGFGLPVLEAMAVGTPVVAANVASLPEVAGEAAQYVNPEYVPGIAAGLRQAITSDSSSALVAYGRKRARRFTWRRCAQQTIEVYERCKEL